MAGFRPSCWWLLLVGLLTAAAPAPACEFCSMQGQTLLDDVNQAAMVLFGKLANARLDAKGEAGQGTTELHIEAVIKKHPILGDRKVLVLPRYLPTDGTASKFLIFCDVYKGKIDPYRGVPVKSSNDVARYLQGAVAIRDKPVPVRLRYYFDFLDNPDIEIANDAYKNFANADEKDFQPMAKGLPADKVARWLQDPGTPSFRYGLYASMLGHCGKPEHAAVLRRLLDDAQKRLNSGVDGMLAGYTMLRPDDGWAYIRGILADPTREFGLRYAALRAARFFYLKRPDLVDRKKTVEGVCQLLNDPNIADLAIEDLRKWSCWEAAERVLALFDRPSHDVPILRRAILKYALACPLPRAAAFVQTARKKDADLVADTEEWLRLENGGPAPRPAAGKPANGK